MRPPVPTYLPAVPNISDAIAFFVVFLFSTTLHEAAHAWAAMRGGDLTAYRGGQVSLDPIPHIRREPFGMVVLPLITVILTGWPLGFASAPYSVDWARRYPNRAALMALAGPAANLILVVLSAVALRVLAMSGIVSAPHSITFGHIAAVEAGGWAWPGVVLLLGVTFSENLLLAIFNLLPFPPLDGSGAVPLLLSPSGTRRWQEFMWRNPGLQWIGLLIAWQLFAVIFTPLFFGAVGLLYPGVHYG
ncbi:MAG TPA: site-2 protease family protein [Gemmatimonadaceae bacterium]|nr:site-2 protease family protein [Gemmatimonadaceae bacterium]